MVHVIRRLRNGSACGRRTGTLWAALFLLLLSAASLPAAASAQTAGAAGATLGPLGGIRLGQSGAWSKSVSNGWFVMSNTSDSNAIDFLDIRWRRTRADGRAASVTVLVKGGPGSLAGIFLVNGHDSHKWVALMLRGDGRIGIYLHDRQNGLRLGKVVGRAGPNDARGVTLTIAQNTERTEFRIDNHTVMSLRSHYNPGQPNGGLPPTWIGLGAAGTGTFGFRAFGFTPAGMAPATPPPPGNNGPQQVPGPPPNQNPFPPIGPAPAAPGQNPFPPAATPPAPAPGQNPFPAAPAAPGQNPFPPAGPAAPPAPGQNPFPPAATRTPPPGGNGQSMSLAQFFVGGAWRSVRTNGQATEETDFSFRADGTYVERDALRSPNGEISVNISGRWSVRPVHGATVMLMIQPQQAYPPQICNGGNCRQVPLRPQQFEVTLLGRNSISYNGQTVQRVR